MQVADLGIVQVGGDPAYSIGSRIGPWSTKFLPRCTGSRCVACGPSGIPACACTKDKLAD
jgi:hypothetical protein